MHITRIPDPIDMSDAASKIRASSNFRFAWQFHQIDGVETVDANACRALLNAVVADPTLHEFLRSSIDDIYPREFEICPLHDHCQFANAPMILSIPLLAVCLTTWARIHATFENRTPTNAALCERHFRLLGDFAAYSIFPGNDPDCDECKQYNHQVYSNWFFDVAWDYTYFVVWPDSKIVWVGCFSTIPTETATAKSTNNPMNPSGDRAFPDIKNFWPPLGYRAVRPERPCDPCCHSHSTMSS